MLRIVFGDLGWRCGSRIFGWGWLVLWWVGLTLLFGKQIYIFFSGVGGRSGLIGMVQ